MESLWQGVPVLAFNGDRWVSRISRSLLVAGGISEWCRADLNGYVAKAIALATSANTPAELTVLRSNMRDRLSASPVCDGAGLCLALESIYSNTADAAIRLRDHKR
jgi:protein O-GlcNAc transferase